MSNARYIADLTSAGIKSQITSNSLRLPDFVDRGNGFTLTSAHNGQGTVMNLDDGDQTINLPDIDTVDDQWTHTFWTTGVPSGYQTAYIQVYSGDTLFHKSSITDKLYLIGGNSMIRIGKVEENGTKKWTTEIVQNVQPRSYEGRRYYSGGSSYNSTATSWSSIPANTTGGTNSGVFNYPGQTRIQVPVTGTYYFTMQIAFYADAGGGTTSAGFIAPAVNGSTARSEHGYSWRKFVNGEDNGLCELTGVISLSQGDDLGGSYVTGNSGLWYWLDYSYVGLWLISL